MLPQAAFGGALPVLAQLAARGALNSVRSRFEGALRNAAAIAATAVALLAAPIIRLVYGDDFASAALPLTWVGIGLLPFLVNSARRVALYASGHENLVARWSAVALGVQAAACVALIPNFGAAGGAVAMALGEALVWWPLQRADKKTGTGRDPAIQAVR